MANAATLPLDQRRTSFALRSAAGLVFAIACFWPTLTDSALINLFAVYTFSDGILTLSAGAWGFAHRAAWPLFLGGCADLAAAVAAYAWPAMNLAGLIGLTTIWALALMATFATAAATLRRADDQNLLLLSAIASGLFARALMSAGGAGIVVISTWTGLYGLTLGILFFKLVLRRLPLALLRSEPNPER